jgi:OOP family OmpA-OmpF porin
VAAVIAEVKEVVPVKPETLDTRVQFAFDRSDLDGEAVQKLDRMIAAMIASEGVGKILISGHADRIGPEAYNIQLSERRAEAVRDYLVRRIGTKVPIDIVGIGEAMPLVQCPGLVGDTLVGCLAPNRRAEIDAAALVPE